MNSYQILPFNHTRFSGSIILIVNESGEYYFLPIHYFESLINYSLDQESSVYLDLKSKHFIAEDCIEEPIKLLATQYRTKKGFLREFYRTSYDGYNS